MTLKQYADKLGIHYRTAWNHFKQGLIPRAYQLPTGTIIVPEEELPKAQCVVIYCRVSSSENRGNLEAQANRVLAYANARGYQVKGIIKEIGSGVNDKRRKLDKLLSDTCVTCIVVEHKDRLTRFGFNYLEILLDRLGTKIEVINSVEQPQEDIIQDFVSIITSFCARIYGRRRSRRKTEQLIQELENDAS